MANGETQEDNKGPYDNVTEYERFVNDAIPALEAAASMWAPLQVRHGFDQTPFGVQEAEKISDFIEKIRKALEANPPPAQARQNINDIKLLVMAEQATGERAFGVPLAEIVGRLTKEYPGAKSRTIKEAFELDVLGPFYDLSSRHRS
jgi:hypothetical protein